QMTSDGTKFRVAVLKDQSGGKYKRFLIGTNSADYSKLQDHLSTADSGDKDKENVSTFANLRPQHFTDAVLVRPVSPENVYTQTTIYEDEMNPDVKQKSPIARVMRGYYLLDEYKKAGNGDLVV